MVKNTPMHHSKKVLSSGSQCCQLKFVKTKIWNNLLTWEIGTENISFCLFFLLPLILFGLIYSMDINFLNTLIL